MASEHIRWSGAAAMLGGLLGIALTPLLTFAGMMARPGGGPPPMRWAQAIRPIILPLVTFGRAEDVQHVWGRAALPIYLLFLVGLLGLHSTVFRHVGRWGNRGFQLARVGLLMNVGGNIADYWLGRETLGQALWGAGFFIGTLIGTLLYTIGAVVLGRGILRTGAVPRWTGWVLGVAPLLGIALGFWGVHYMPANFILGNSLGWLLLGYVLWSGKRDGPLVLGGS